jgi:hypothetical protein
MEPDLGSRRTAPLAASLVLAVLCATTLALAAPLSDGTERFRSVALRDLVTGAEAYRILVPAGWQVEGGVTWIPERAAAPTSLAVRASNPGAPEEYDFFPPQLFQWSPLGERIHGLGASVGGARILRPPDGPLPALRQIVMPLFRPQVREYSIIAAEELPRLAQAGAALYQQPGAPPGTVTAGRLLVEYPEGREVMREELTCFYVRAEGIGGVIWALDQITSFKAPRGRLSELLPVFRTIAFSLQPNLDWYNEMTLVTQTLVQGALYTQGEIMKRAEIERRKNAAVSGIIRQEYEARQAVVSRMHENYDTKAIRGVERRSNPFTGGTEDVPNEYRHAWVNPLGEHLFTNNPSFDPNIGSTLRWQELEKAK